MVTVTAREDCILFASTYPTPNVRAAVQYAHAGTITWEQCADLFRKALAAGIADVQ